MVYWAHYLGRCDLSEAANSGVYFKNWESLAGVTEGIWRRALARRGAGARGQPKERRGKFAMLTFPLPPLGFPLPLPFPDSLSPLVRTTFVDGILGALFGEM